MIVTKYDEGSGKPYQYLYSGQFDYEEAVYAVFYATVEEYMPPVILRIEGRHFVDIFDPEEEERLQDVVEQLEEEWENEEPYATRQ
jgi:hypothetical protein